MNYGKKVTKGWTDSRPSRILDDNLWIMEEKVTKGLTDSRPTTTLDDNLWINWETVSKGAWQIDGRQIILDENLGAKVRKGAWHIQVRLGWDDNLWITQKWPPQLYKIFVPEIGSASLG
jgi:hypothetical protein